MGHAPTNSLMLMMARVNGKKMQVTVDTGAKVSIMKKDIILAMMGKVLLQTIMGETSEALDKAEVEVELVRFTIRHKVFVADIVVDLWK